MADVARLPAPQQPDPSRTELAADAHAWFCAFTGAGFTDNHALELVKAIITAPSTEA